MQRLLSKDFIHNVRLGKYVPDFHSPQRKIVIEVDGDNHYVWYRKQRDAEKNKYWQQAGYKVFRFRNCDVDRYMQPLLEGFV